MTSSKKGYSAIPDADNDLDVVVYNKDVTPIESEAQRRDRRKLIIILVALVFLIRCIFWFEGNASQAAFMKHQEALDSKIQQQLSTQNQQIQSMKERQRANAARLNQTVPATQIFHHKTTPMHTGIVPPAPSPGTTATASSAGRTPATPKSGGATPSTTSTTNSSSPASATPTSATSSTSSKSASASTSTASADSSTTSTTAASTSTAASQVPSGTSSKASTTASSSSSSIPVASSTSKTVPATKSFSTSAKGSIPPATPSTTSTNASTQSSASTVTTASNSAQQSSQLRGGMTTHQQKHQEKRWWKNVKHWWHHFVNNQPLRLYGGGRDWWVDPITGVISAKHQQNLYVGADPTTPLVLVPIGSPEQLVFDQVPSRTNNNTVQLVARGGYGVELEQQQVKYLDQEIRYIPGVVTTNGAPLTVQFVENNFVYLPSMDLTLDVAWWHLVEGNRVVFAGGPNPGYTLIKGGACGRNWVWDANMGTISPHGRPDLTLGRGIRSLVLTDQSSEAIVLQDGVQLALGAPVPMVVDDGSDTVDITAPVQESKWMVSRTAVVQTPDPAVLIHWDGTFILLENDYMALEVMNWDMQPGTPINFVGPAGHHHHPNQQGNHHHHHHPNQNHGI